MGRALTFSDPAVQALLRERFVLLAGDDWYRRRQEDEVGRFFRAVAGQGPRKGEDGATRQGLYVLTAGGKLLAYRNHQDPRAVEELLRKGLAAWEALPEEERAPRALELPAPEIDPRFARERPEGALVVRVHARELERGPDGTYRRAPPRPGSPGQASSDHLWVLAEEAAALLREGAAFPPALARRIARFHLVDATRGEPPHWSNEEVKELALEREMTAEVSATGAMVRLRLSGKVALASADGARSYQAKLEGQLEVHRWHGGEKWTRFDLVALGDHTGEGTYTPHARPGPTPLGVAFSLADGERPGDDVPPQAARDLQGYLAAR